MGCCVGRCGPRPPLRVAPRGGRERSLARAREERRRAAPQAGAMVPHKALSRSAAAPEAGAMVLQKACGSVSAHSGVKQRLLRNQ